VRLKIEPSSVSGELAAPSSKSYTHRAVIVASLAEGGSIIENPLLSDDTLYTINACRILGADIELREDSLAVKGTGGEIKPEKPKIFAGNSGSTIRMIAPLAALAPTKIILPSRFRGESLRQTKPPSPGKPAPSPSAPCS